MRVYVRTCAGCARAFGWWLRAVSAQLSFGECASVKTAEGEGKKSEVTRAARVGYAQIAGCVSEGTLGE